MPYSTTLSRRRPAAIAALVVAALLAVATLKVAIPAAGQARPNPTPDARVLGHPPKDQVSPDKRAVLEADERAWQTAVALPPRPHDQATPGPARTQPNLHASDETPAGAGIIFPGNGFPFRSANRFENRWLEQKPDQVIGVFAGEDGATPDQGLVAVVVSTPAGLGVKYYRSPDRAGSLHVVSAVGERLTLLAKNGSRLIFDVASRTFTRG